MRKADFEAISRTLNEASVPFIVVGGIAVIEHGYGRNTIDVDLVIRLQPQTVRAAFAALALIGYHPRVPISAEEFAYPAARERMIVESGMRVLNFWSDQHRDTPLDVFVTEPFDFMREYERAIIREPSPGLPVRILCLEALLE
jgi:hypothetical protein